MRKRKIYGQSQEKNCPFCGKRASTENSQGVPVCRNHKTSVIEQKFCVCGEALEIRKSKYGAFFLCSNCGPISWSKAEAMNEGNSIFKTQRKVKPVKSTKVVNDPVRTFIAKEMNGGIPSIDELMDTWEDEPHKEHTFIKNDGVSDTDSSTNDSEVKDSQDSEDSENEESEERFIKI